MAPLANPQTTVIGNVGSHRAAVTGETFANFLTVSQDSVAVTRTTPFSQPLTRYSPSGEKRRIAIELVCPVSVSTHSYLGVTIRQEDKGVEKVFSRNRDILHEAYACFSREIYGIFKNARRAARPRTEDGLVVNGPTTHSSHLTRGRLRFPQCRLIAKLSALAQKIKRVVHTHTYCRCGGHPSLEQTGPQWRERV